MSDTPPPVDQTAVDQTAVNQTANALRQSWSAESSIHDAWTKDNPAKGQCEPSSFVAWERLGGSLVLGQVFIDGEFSEHHYWNRIGGTDIDFTAEQFTGVEEIREVAELTSDEIRARLPEMKPEFKTRIETLRTAVDLILD